MNLQNIINDIESVDPEVYERLNTRRKAMKSFANISGKLALAAVPVALGSMFNKAYGQAVPTAVIDSLKFALLLEQLEAAFYNAVVAAPGLNATLTGTSRAAFVKIQADENKHVAFLSSTIASLTSMPAPAAPAFDLTGGNSAAGTGPFSGANDPRVNYAVALAMSQTFEDTGVRAYKGQAANFLPSTGTVNDLLEAALKIHSVEARHAAKIRILRRELGGAVLAPADLKPWINNNESGILPPFAALVQASYDGEGVTQQGAFNGVGTFSGVTISATAASAAFDEPLTKAQVTAIVDPFII
ncbi:MAG: ferritin-like domain-containing protein [Ferruginibacter sp.]